MPGSNFHREKVGGCEDLPVELQESQLIISTVRVHDLLQGLGHGATREDMEGAGDDLRRLLRSRSRRIWSMVLWRGTSRCTGQAL